MLLLRVQRGRLRSFFWGTVFISVMAIISTVFYGRHRMVVNPRAVSETEISQQTQGDSPALPRYETPWMNRVVGTHRNCHPRNNFIFIKIQKTGSSTVTNMLQRYAIDRELTVMVPTCTMCALSWPTSPERGMYLQSKNGKYSAIVHHTRYNKTWMESMFPSDTAYITVIREPFGHLKSVFNYYHLSGKLLQRKVKRPGDENPIQLFLKSPFEHRYVIGYKHCEVTFERTRNFQAFDLGYKQEWADDEGKAERFLADIERDFTLVMILEHFDESLVLLRRLMCWELKDILYDSRPKKQRSYAYKDYKPSDEERGNHEEFNKVDYMLYEHFNRSLWNKIISEGPAFFTELEYYKQLNNNISKHCSDSQAKRGKLIVPSSEWTTEFHVSDEFCYRLRTKRTKNLDGPLRAHLVKSERKHVFGRCLPMDQYVVLKGNTIATSP
ncbi:PREDICTED: galactose-3-O-sulfotransferase 2-like [Branchiostoma belcheri]|uniref:Galactose-3-O-sulfotransferase 2-like n=1 Tax=Branchiostoma belcheri TaxID=7741 RepID=A0A6P4YLI9_BRABE|nr:PREDICTED: galactose-3-O-sulfotransferase 2-like [Branchiostoma belcheri]XP_019617996.1 PREDICTED: galactose-3-O-sulfotransferase 2-like [Branchiostoma belcheri]